MSSVSISGFRVTKNGMGKDYNEILKRTIHQPYKLSSELTNLIVDQCRIQEFKKKHKLSETGKMNNSEYFLLDGIIHRYTLVVEGEFITTGFYVGPTILMPNFVRTSNGKSVFSLQALTDIIVAEIPAATLNELKDSHEEIRRWGENIIERKLKRNFIDEIRFRTSNAKDRLEHLRSEFPNLENLVPHTCIASYMGITPVSFSRLRKELTESS